MTAKFERAWAKASRANLAASVGFLLARPASRSAAGTWRRRGGCKPNAYRPCGDEIPNAQVISEWLPSSKFK